jgi:pyocin large subunit-like protein
MAGMRMALPLTALGMTAALALLAACDNGPSAVAGKQAAGTQMASAQAPARTDQAGDTAQVDHRHDPVKLAADGKAMWSSSKKYSAEESAQHSFERNGEAFGAHDIDDFVSKAHAFVEHPPKSVQTIRRANGDTLFYDPKSNVFAVANKDGAPRTMFKPDDGKAYWDEQKSREGARAEHRSRSNDDA